jgi:hypothetical protein
MGCAGSRSGARDTIEGAEDRRQGHRIRLNDDALDVASPRSSIVSVPQSPEYRCHERSKHLISSIIVENRSSGISIKDFYDFERTPTLGSG